MPKNLSLDKKHLLPVISEIVDRIIPAHIRTDHPKFVEFIQVFFSFLENENKSSYYQNSIADQRNILSQDDQFLTLIQNEIGLFVPQKYVADPKLFYNRIIDLWKSKGSEESIRTFFRLFLDKDIDLYYPWSDVLIVSDGRWIIDNQIVVTAITGFGNPLNLEGKSIVQLNTGATARVERVNLRTYGSLNLYSITLVKETIVGTFVFENDIVSTDNAIRATVKETVKNIKVNDSGLGYAIGDRIYIPRINTRTFVAYINQINSQGSIISVRIEDYGALSSNDNIESVDFRIESKNGNGANLEAVFGSLIITDGYYEGVSGQLSESNVLQDSEYYQKFSYEIVVNSPINVWKDAFRKTIHPSGFKVFSNFLIEKDINSKIKKTSDLLTKKVPRETNFIESIKLKSDINISKQDYVTKRTTGSYGKYFDEQYLLDGQIYVDIDKQNGFYFKDDYIGEYFFYSDVTEGKNDFSSYYLDTGLFTCKWEELFAVKAEKEIDNRKVDLDLRIKNTPSVVIQKILDNITVDVNSHLRKIFFRREFTINSPIENVSTAITTLSGAIHKKLLNKVKSLSSITKDSIDTEILIFERPDVVNDITCHVQNYVRMDDPDGPFFAPIYNQIAYFAENYTTEISFYVSNNSDIYAGTNYTTENIVQQPHLNYNIIDNTFDSTEKFISLEKPDIIKSIDFNTPENELNEKIKAQSTIQFESQDYVNNYSNIKNVYFGETYTLEDYIFNRDGRFFAEYFMGKSYENVIDESDERSNYVIIDNTFELINKNTNSNIAEIIPIAADTTINTPNILLHDPIKTEVQSFVFAQDYVNNFDRFNSYFENPFESKNYFAELYNTGEAYVYNISGAYVGIQSESINAIQNEFEVSSRDIIDNQETNVNQNVNNKTQKIVPFIQSGTVRYQESLVSKIESVSVSKDTLLTRFIESIHINSELQSDVKPILPRNTEKVISIETPDIIKSIDFNIPENELNERVKTQNTIQLESQDYVNNYSNVKNVYFGEIYTLEDYIFNRDGRFFAEYFMGKSYENVIDETIENSNYVIIDNATSYNIDEKISSKSNVKTRIDINIEPTFDFYDQPESSTEFKLFGQDYTNEFTTLGKFYFDLSENYISEEYNTDRQDTYFSREYIQTPYFNELFTTDNYVFDDLDVYVGYKYNKIELLQEEAFLETSQNI